MVAFFGGGKEKVEVVQADGQVEMVDKVINPQAGFFWTVVCFAAIAVVLFTITFLTTRERVEPEQKSNNHFSSDLKDLLKNRPWVVLLFVGLFQILAGWTRGSATGYYFKYFTEIGEKHLFNLGEWGQFGNIGDFGFFFGIGTIFSIAGMFLTRPLVKMFGNKMLMILVMFINAMCMGGFLFLQKDQWQLMYGLHCLGAFISGPMPILLWAMYADAADYSEWMNRRRATGLVFAAATFSQKMGSALGAAVPGWLLAVSGYVKPVDDVPQPQSDQTITWIVCMMSVIPAFFLICSCVAMAFYNLNKELIEKIEHELKERKTKAAETSKSLPEST